MDTQEHPQIQQSSVGVGPISTGGRSPDDSAMMFSAKPSIAQA